MRARVQFTLALVLDGVGTGGVLLAATRPWQTIRTALAFRSDTLHVAGRTIDSGPTAFALVALAGGIAVIATRGRVRRAVGVIIAASGVGIAWRVLMSLSAVSVARARELVGDKHPSAALTTAVPHVSTTPVWGVLSLVGAVLVVGGGALVAARGDQWTAMSSRYEAPAVQQDPDTVARERARADAALWTALERGDDPTARDPRDP